MHKTTSNSAKDLVALFHFDINSLGAELIDSLRLSQKHDFHLVSFWVNI